MVQQSRAVSETSGYVLFIIGAPRPQYDEGKKIAQGRFIGGRIMNFTENMTAEYLSINLV